MNGKNRSKDRTVVRHTNDMRDDLLRFHGTVQSDAGIQTWFANRTGKLGEEAKHWFRIMRACGDEVREVLHDGCPVACLGDAPFAYVNVFTAHTNVGFFHGASLRDPARLLQGSGKHMRHVKIRIDSTLDCAALEDLIDAAFADIKARVEHASSVTLR